eukprot:CFRG5539T1
MATTSAAKFTSLCVDPRLVRSLTRSGFNIPTPIQRLAIPQLLQKSNTHCLLGAETGSGKTLAYLLPTLQRLAENRDENALILLPTSELVEQVYDVASRYAKCVDVGVSMASRFHRMSVFGNTRLIVGTPAALLSYPHVDRTKDLGMLVLDEADLLLSASMLPSVESLLGDIGKLPQTTLAAATLPTAGTKSLNAKVNKMFPNALRLSTEGWHRTVSHLRQAMVRVTSDTKLSLLVNILKMHEKSPITNDDLLNIKTTALEPRVQASASDIHTRRVLVFANTTSSANEAYEALQQCFQNTELKNAVLHGQLDSDRRAKAWTDFSSGEVSVLVSTDVAARGLDIDEVDLVVQYDFALNAVDYLHRVGRTARNGRDGVAINFITPSDEDRAKAIDEFNTIGMEPVFSRRRSFRRNIKRHVDGLMRNS